MGTRIIAGVISGLLIISGIVAWSFFTFSTGPDNSTVPSVAQHSSPSPSKSTEEISHDVLTVAAVPDPAASHQNEITQSGTGDPFLSYMSMITTGSAKDVPQLKEMYEGLEEGPEKYAAFFSLLKFWAKSDPDAAMKYAMSIKVKERDIHKLYDDIYGSIARSNPDAFVVSILNETDPDTRKNRSTAAIRLLSESNPALVVPVIQAEQRPDEQEALMDMWLKDVCKNHPDTVLDLVMGFSEFDTRQRAATTALSEVSRLDPELAGFHYTNLLRDTEAKLSVLPDIVKGYYRNSDGNTLVLNQWLKSNLTTSAEYDTAAATMVDLLLSSDVNGALTWLKTIEDENLYNATVQAIEKKYSKNKIPEPKP